MRHANGAPFAQHPFPDQVIATFKGFAIEVCMRDESLNTVFRLRYRSYLASETIPPNKEELLYDEYDFLPNARNFLIWFEGKAVAAVRSCIYSDHYNWVPTEGIKYFSEVIGKQLGADACILESNRFAVDPDFQGRQSLFAQFLLFRAHGLNAAAHRCSHIITSVRANHRAFYQRYLGMMPLTEDPVYVPWADTEVYVVANETEVCLAAILKRGMPGYGKSDITHYVACAGLPEIIRHLAA